jgi:hypothetical protein
MTILVFSLNSDYNRIEMVKSTLAGVVLLIISGCSRSAIIVGEACEPGTTEPCTCEDGSEGSRTCSDGAGWGECLCAPADAGADVGVEEPEETVEVLDVPPDPDGADPEADDAAEEDIAEEEDGGFVYVCPPTPDLKLYSGGACPVITGGPTAATSVVRDFYSAGDMRNFRFLVPASYDGSGEWPLVFAWHWLNASSRSFVEEGELETAAEEMRMLIVLPDVLEDDSGNKAYFFDWPFDPTCSNFAREKELTFFDDLLTCISLQYSVDRCRVHAVGVSAGALWVTYLSTTDRVMVVASLESLSGGLAEIPLSLWTMQYVPQPNKFPAVVLWGGVLDIFPPINFNQASIRYRDALIADNHFVLTCTHGSGHAVPPIDPPPDGGTRFRSLWDFFMDHPYGLPPRWSSYQATGLPADFPDWCTIATPWP